MDLKFSGIVLLIELIGMSEGNCHRGLCKEMVKEIALDHVWMCNLRPGLWAVTSNLEIS